ncbi:MAG: N-acetyltransferase [Chitinophagia bacterium]|nr:N-acetyltransferase [Chitinophagia bacterium]
MDTPYTGNVAEIEPQTISIHILVSIQVNEQVLLRSYVRSDAAALFRLVNDNRAHLTPWLNWVEGTTKVEHSAEFIEGSRHNAETQQGLALGIFVNNQLAGGMGMHDWQHPLRKAQIGYWVAQPYEGQGIVYQSAQHFVAFLFEKVGLNKVELHYAAPNVRSGRLAGKRSSVMALPKTWLLPGCCAPNGRNR